MKFTNNADIPLALAVWLVDDDYDYVKGIDNYISVTQLLKPTKQVILSRRVPEESRVADLEDYISRGLGNSFHASIEKAWKHNYKENLTKLGYPESMINKIIINPTKEQLKPDCIPLYFEQRAFRKFKGFTIGGKFDIVAEGIVQDNKSTSVYTWMHRTKEEDYILQGSLYRWLNPEIITEDFIRINYIFTDWQKALAKNNPEYPQHRMMYKDYQLMSLEDTEAWLTGRLNLLSRFQHLSENEIPECTDEELWRSDPVYKYYSDISKTEGRCTKKFTDAKEAREYLISKNGKGCILTVPGEVKRCLYCDAYSVCKQKDRYFND